jgi:hypothetical protein
MQHKEVVSVRGHIRKNIKSDRRINKKNEILMIEKIFSYSPKLLKGIEVYKDANRNFMLLIFLGALLINFPIISIPCCTLAIFYIIKMLQYIKYNSINNVVKILAKDLAFKGIYDREKVEDMLYDFRAKYGEGVNEYTELVDMLRKYDSFINKIDSVLKNINIKEKERYEDNLNISDKSNAFLSERIKNMQNHKKTLFISRRAYNTCNELNNQLPVFYEKEDGQIKMVSKAIDFFDNEDSNCYNKENAIVLKDTNKENKNLTVYLYKKSSPIFEKNAL